MDKVFALMSGCRWEAGTRQRVEAGGNRNVGTGRGQLDRAVPSPVSGPRVAFVTVSQSSA